MHKALQQLDMWQKELPPSGEEMGSAAGPQQATAAASGEHHRQDANVSGLRLGLFCGALTLLTVMLYLPSTLP